MRNLFEAEHPFYFQLELPVSVGANTVQAMIQLIEEQELAEEVTQAMKVFATSNGDVFRTFVGTNNQEMAAFLQGSDFPVTVSMIYPQKDKRPNSPQLQSD
jgi:hypothetical protein